MKEWVKRKGKKILFYHHKEVGAKIKEYIPNNSFLLDGSVPRAKRGKVVAEWEKLPDGVLILSISSFSEGIDLRSATEVMMFETTWSYFKDRQAIGRFIDINSNVKKTVTYVYFKNEYKKLITDKKYKFHKLLDWRTNLEAL